MIMHNIYLWCRQYGLKTLILGFVSFNLQTNISQAADKQKKWTASEKIILTKVSTYLQNLNGLEGWFIQINPQGTTASGSFLYQQPGRLKFVYNAPLSQIVMVNNNTLYIQEEPGRQPTTYPVSATPLPLFFNANIDLLSHEALNDITQSSGLAELLLDDPTGDIPGQLYMVFETTPVRMRGWRVVDAQGQVISVLLRNLVHRDDIEEKDFKLDYRRKRGFRK